MTDGKQAPSAYDAWLDEQRKADRERWAKWVDALWGEIGNGGGTELHPSARLAMIASTEANP